MGKNSKNVQTGSKWTRYYCKVSRQKDDFFQKLFICLMALLFNVSSLFRQIYKIFLLLSCQHNFDSFGWQLDNEILQTKSLKKSLSIEKLSSIFAKNVNFLQLCRNYKTSLTWDRNLNHSLVCTGPIRHIHKMQPNLEFSISKKENSCINELKSVSYLLSPSRGRMSGGQRAAAAEEGSVWPGQSHHQESWHFTALQRSLFWAS